VAREEAPRSRISLWAQVLLSGALLAFVLVGVNVLARKFYLRKDLTTERAFELDDATLQRLRALDRDVTIYLVFPGQEVSFDRCLPTVWQRIGVLCEEFRKRSSRIKVEIVTEANPSALEDLRRHFESPVSNSIYVVAHFDKERFGKKALGVRAGSFYDGDPTTGRVDNFFGERWLLAALVASTQEKKRVVYSLIGHEEMTVPSGLTVLARFLEEREGVELRPLPLKDLPGVPGDAEGVLVAAPQSSLEPREIDLLKEYMSRGGGVFFAVDPGSRADLQTFLRDFGVEARRGVVLDNYENLRHDRRFLRVQRYSDHEINRGMQNLNMSFIVPLTSIVRPANQRVAGCVVTPLFFSGPQAWEETGPLNQPRPVRDPGELSAMETEEKQFPLGVAVSVALGRHDARMIVWGSASALFDYNIGRLSVMNLEYILNHFRWLVGREELIAVPPKRPGQRPMDLAPPTLARIQWITILGFPMLGIVMGFLAWFLRRK